MRFLGNVKKDIEIYKKLHGYKTKEDQGAEDNGSCSEKPETRKNGKTSRIKATKKV